MTAASMSVPVRLHRLLLGLYVIALATSMGGMEIFSTALCLSFLWLCARESGLPKEPLPFWPAILAFVAVAAIGIVMGSATPKEKLYDLGRMRFFILYAVLFYSLRTYARNFPWVTVLAVIATLVGLYGFVQHFVAIDLFRPEGKKVLMYAIQDRKIGPLVVGTFNHHLTFSNIYLFYACLFTSLGIHAFARNRAPLVLGLFLYLLCVWTQSRAAWVAIPVTLYCIVWGKGKTWALLAFFGAIVVLASLYFTDLGFRERFNRTVFGHDELYSGQPRERLWRAQLYFFREKPLFGVGYNNNERRAKEVLDKLYPDVKDKFYGHAHSTFLQILATTGLFGVLAYLWMWGGVLAAGIGVMRRSSRETARFWMALGLFAGFIGFQIQGLTQWNFGDAEVIHNVLFFWAVTAALWVECAGHRAPA